ncbi:hypothetical protein B0I28_109101 [Glycomyces artemisiae]|uniref:Uncharacterized protein n=1 Tax=Glycomyces artemisiae TaxID=1076443 RepID=A0A2T0UEX8_9ACTN|nr:hypothetical protein B0I28_109101 [Glycomyces artemisiae]
MRSIGIPLKLRVGEFIASAKRAAVALRGNRTASPTAREACPFCSRPDQWSACPIHDNGA